MSLHLLQFWSFVEKVEILKLEIKPCPRFPTPSIGVPSMVPDALANSMIDWLEDAVSEY